MKPPSFFARVASTCIALGASATLSHGQLVNGLLNYWDFEGDFEDNAGEFPGSASTTDDDGTNAGGNVALSGGGPLGIYGDFARDYVEVSDSADLIAANENLSISAWFRVDGFDQSWQALIGHGEGSDYRIARRGDGQGMGYAGGVGDIPGSDMVPVNDGLWHHVVAITEHNVSTRLWVDGNLVATGGVPALTDNGAGRLMIGGNPQGNAGDAPPTQYRPWNGGIDDVAMWDRVLTDAEIGDLYNGGLAGDSLAILLDPNDDDDDGLPNAWEVANGLDPDDPTGDNGAEGDPDNDGVNNVDEFDDGTDPQDDDTDNDFSTDGEERDNGTDPLDPDSDDDSLLDGHETNNGPNSYVSPTDTGTDPNELDTDNDGVGDGLEIALGTDPTDGADTPPATALPITDDFEDGLLNTVDWTTNTDFAGSAVAETGGSLRLTSRGYLVTAGQFDPEVEGPICVSGEWTFGSADDFIQILTRSDGQIDPANCCGETLSGVEFFAFAQDGNVTIRARNADHTISNVVQSGSITFANGGTYVFAAVDFGNGNLSFAIEDKANAANAILVTATLDADFSATDHIVFHNREGGRTSTLDNVNIKVLPDADGDGMDDDWEEANGLNVGIDDSGGDPDMDGSTNLQEFNRGTDPQDEDSDDDGALDGSETNTGTFASTGDRGTDPLDPDTDGDGALDGVEDNTGFIGGPDSIGTDPHNPDSDGDGLGDGAEIEVGRDPNNPNDGPPPLGVGLLAYWNFDGTLEDQAHGTVPSDSTIADHGAFTGPETDVGFAAEGLFGSSALEQNGEAGWVTVPRSTDTLRGTDNTVSISAWFKATAFDTSWQALISHGEGSQYRIARHGGEATQAMAYAGGSGDITGGSNYNDGAWHHIVAISEGGVSTRMWIDGVLIATGDAPTINDQGNSNPVDADLFIGNNPQALGREWEGCIDDVAIWRRVLTEDEVSEVYNGGLGGDSLGALLGVGGGGSGFEITNIVYDPTGGAGGLGEFTLTWTSREGENYGVYYSSDLQNWGSDVNDSYPADPGETTSFTFNHPAPGAKRLNFRVIQNE